MKREYPPPCTPAASHALDPLFISRTITQQISQNDTSRDKTTQHSGISRGARHQTQDRPSFGIYLSPLREEQAPSFKVDYSQNIWYDHGTGKGGSIIDLVMELEQCTYAEAISKLRERSDIPIQPHTPKTESPLVIRSVTPLTDPHLTSYLRERAIDLDAARHYCREVSYSIGEKTYFAIGFKSDGDGWELRNKFFKGSCSPKGITTFQNNSPTCMLFEGFMDMLSYLTLKKQVVPPTDMVVLNSVNNLSKAIGFLKDHSLIHAFLDTDQAGRRALDAVQKLGVEVVDQSHLYRNFKDLNDYLLNHSKVKKQVYVPGAPEHDFHR